MSEYKRVGSQTLTDLILSLSKEQKPVTFLIYSLILPWAGAVARDLSIPSAFLCIQSATALAIFNHYFSKQEGMYENYKSNPPSRVKIQGLPPFSCEDLPSFLLPTSPHPSILPTIQEHIQTLEEDPNPCVLINTIDALEGEAIRAVQSMNLITVGPLIPSAFLEQDLNKEESSFRCDLFERSNNYLQWLDSKQERSVVYVSFGSLVVLQKKQITEILHGLLESGWPFLWVIRFSENNEEEAVHNTIKNNTEEEGRGLIVPWCSQLEVLTHRAIGCFVTHCGWNSTLESMAAGVPVVACPQFSDQNTNAKLVEEVWGNGVRAKVNEDGIIEREEIRRCVNELMGGGDTGKDMERTCAKWKSILKEAAKEKSSSHSQLKIFLEKLI